MNIAAPFAIYGYNIVVPDEEPLEFIHDILSINDTLVEPIQVYCMTPHLTMSGFHDVQVIIGFIPEHSLSQSMKHLDTLREFIMDNPMFDGITINEQPKFYVGFKWVEDVDSEIESDVESDVDSESESESESDVDSESEVESDNCESTDESNDKALSYYISKYYI